MPGGGGGVHDGPDAAGRRGHDGCPDRMAGFSPDPRSPVRNKVVVLPQYLLPKRALTRLAGRVASSQGGRLTASMVQRFARAYGVDMTEAANSDLRSYKTFNDFFTRALRPGVRPIADADLVCPVDGAISHFGTIEHDQIFQAKGHRYSTRALVGGDAELAARFDHGSYATLYLSPRDYHRVHMPCDGRLSRMIHVPGSLFSVNPATARGVPGLFARNERVVSVFEGPRGPFVMVLVGATIVGSMATAWHGAVNADRPGRLREWRYEDRELRLAKADEMGRFLLGSTVVLLFPRGPLAFNPDWKPERAVRLGEAMASYG